jgi:hypothetical protein
MQATSGLSVITVIMGIFSAALVAAIGLGVSIPVIGGGRAAFFALALMGAIMCKRGVVPWLGFSDPFTWAGTALGVVNLLLVAVVLFRVRVPLVTTDRAATLALGGSMAAKVVLALLRSALA